jgi:hypothetical protein
MAGSTKACLPKSTQNGWLYSYTDTHWQTVQSTIELLEKIIIPFLNNKKAELNLPQDQYSLILWDVWYVLFSSF